MDPVTAFQVAASVIAFVDFSRTLLSDAHHVYKSPNGQTARMVRLSEIESDLRSLRVPIEECLAALPGEESQSDHVIVELCEQCRQIEAALQGTLRDMTAAGMKKIKYGRMERAGKSFITAARDMGRRKQLEALEQRLGSIHSRMMMAIMVSLW